jgi:hypothetical protein
MADDDEEGGYGNKEAFHPDLVHKLIVAHYCSKEGGESTATAAPPRISPEGLVAAGELLRLFVLEAKDRASIEAECDYEATVEQDKDDDNSNDDDNDDDNGCQDAPTKDDSIRAVSSLSAKKKNNNNKTTYVPIRPDHVTKIAADLVFDFAT